MENVWIVYVEFVKCFVVSVGIIYVWVEKMK